MVLFQELIGETRFVVVVGEVEEVDHVCVCESVFVRAEDAPGRRSQLAVIQVGSTQVDTRRTVIVCVGWLVG